MVAFVKKRLQIFVSSTYIDLKEERQAAVEAILTAGHIPAGMELFTSGDESQMDVIKQWIDESDIYLLILGGRYGSIEPNSGKSYTQLEYEYAISNKKPFFACVISDTGFQNLPKEKIELEESKKLREFRSLVTGKIVKFWDDYKDIKIAVAEKMAHFERDSDLLGWVRPQEQPDMANLINEITRLSKENADLRHELDEQKNVFHSNENNEFNKLWDLLSEELSFHIDIKATKKTSSLFDDDNHQKAEDNFILHIKIDIDFQALYILYILKLKYDMNNKKINDFIFNEALKHLNNINQDVSYYANKTQCNIDIEHRFLSYGLLNRIAHTDNSIAYQFLGHNYKLILSDKFNRFNYWLMIKGHVVEYENYNIFKHIEQV